MRIIVDSNRIISALIKNGSSRVIINSDLFEFYTPDYVIEEVLSYNQEIIKKSKLDARSVELLFLLFTEKINIVPYEEIKTKLSEAMQIMKDIDIYDSPILACALVVPNDGIWSEDKHFERQNNVKVWKTKELLKYLV